jgi:type VI secretion system protein ImpE
MNSEALLRSGKLSEAIASLGAELRDQPGDNRKRTFLFEMLCYAGEYDRAQKHLDILAGGGTDASMGALVYHAALHAERTRQEMFQKKETPGGGESADAAAIKGTLNGKPFESLEDADPRVGPRLEVFAAGSYLWIPFEHVASLEIPAPKRLRDLLWTPGLLKAGPKFKGTELGEVLLPALVPLSWRHPDEQVRLGRMTVWEEEEGEAVPFGQKMLLVDGEEFPFLDVRHLEIEQPAD